MEHRYERRVHHIFPEQGLGVNEPIQHLRQSITEGKHWYIALLEAIGLWQIPEETHAGHHYRYLIAEEAFDWLLLAQRLCDEITDLVPESERTDLASGKFPLSITKDEFKSLIGNRKYHAHLNYFYGVMVEQALHLVVQMEIEKDQQLKPCREGLQDRVFQNIYGDTEFNLLSRYRDQKGHAYNENMSLTEFDEFTYWLFKYRFANCDSARVASDTKKALSLLEQSRQDIIEFD